MKILSFSLIFSLFLLVGFQSQAQQGNKKAEKHTLKKSKDNKEMKVLKTQSKVNKEKVQLQKKEAKKQKQTVGDASTDQERPRLEPKQQSKDKGNEMKPKHKAQDQPKGKGNAYGKNKGEMSGKEFGTARAEEAKMTNQKKTVETKESMDKADEAIKKAYDRLEQKQDEFKKDLDAGEITQADYDRKTEQVNKALNHMAELKKKIIAGREQIKE